ncbi:MAG: hypothetical protein ABI772_14740 [Bacteroidota bacterium]
MKCNLLLLLMLVAAVTVHAEKVDTTAVHTQCLLIAASGDSILRGTSDSVRIIYNEKFHAGIDSVLKMPQSFAYSFATIKNLSVLTSDDDHFRLYTWMVPTDKGMKYQYFGFVQVYNEEKKTVKIYSLQEKEYASNDAAEYLKLNDSTWYGALYYKIVHKRYDKKDQYILLGWKGNNVYTTRKVIDNIVITPAKIEFGKPVFKCGGKPKSRVILEYNATANVSLKYNEDERMIIHDHLSSSDPKPESKGVFALYGPDMTYIGYSFKDGFWFMEKDVQVRNDFAPGPKNVELNRDLRLQRKD